jgi:hypothetical protein
VPSNQIETRYLRELEHAVARLINNGRAAEGSGLPPTQRGDNRVPPVQNLQCLQAKAITGGTEFTLSWNDAPVAKTSYIVHPFLATSLTAYTTLPSQSVSRSPATLRIMSDSGKVVMFKVQTVMANGLASAVENSASCTSKTV